MGEENAVPMRINGVEGAAGEVKISGGPGVLETWGAVATKEFFVPATFADSGGSAAVIGDVPGISLTDDNHAAYMSFHIPADFSSIISAVVVIISSTTGSETDWDTFSDYAATGQAYNTHSESNTATVYDTTTNQWFEIDVSGILSSLAAGDHGGIQVKIGLLDPADGLVVGLKFKYS